MERPVRVRIAPSPTGFAHVGTAYTAVFNFAFARKNSGKFILRLEDTDIKRNVPGAETAIYEGLSWLGLTWDEGPDVGGRFSPYRQSERLNIYQQEAKRLLRRGLAFEDNGAIRFKNPGKDVFWKDLIRGEIKFPGSEITDFVILKANGFPTYNFGVVVDDIYMEISHVIRGEEHISNTPKQIALYNAFEKTPPEFAHLPTLRNKDRKKLSKRRDPVDLRIYKKEGLLPQALVNFLCLLGWSHPEGKEIFDMEEFIRFFSLERVRKAGPIFDLSKLNWINGEYIRKLSPSELGDEIYEFFNGKYPKYKIGKILPLVQTRIKNLKEFENLAGFFFEKPKVVKDLFGVNYKRHLKVAFELLSGLKNFNIENLNKAFKKAIEENSFNTGDFFMDLRIAIAGSRITPPINESILILGKKETLHRLEEVLNLR